MVRFRRLARGLAGVTREGATIAAVPGADTPFTLSRGKGSEERTNMMLKISRGTLACVAAAGALAAGCTLTGVSAANAATDKPAKVSGFAVKDGSVTTDGATLTWDRDAGATSYRVVIGNASTPTAWRLSTLARG